MEIKELRDTIKTAESIFPGVLDAIYLIKYNVNLDLLAKTYNELNPESNSQVKQAHQYTQEILGISSSLTTEKVLNVLIVHDRLIYQISQYKFNTSDDKSRWYKQTQTNKSILLDIKMLRATLLKTLANIDSYLKATPEEPQEEDIRLNNMIIAHLNVLPNRLMNAISELSNAREEYYKACSVDGKRTCLPVVPDYPDLGKKKQEWRRKRNEALHVILEFYEKIVAINDIIPIENMPFANPADRQEYENIKEYIESGPYAYSYLTLSERSYQIAKNKARKKARKNGTN